MKKMHQGVSLEGILTAYDYWLSKGNGLCPSVHNVYEMSENQGFDSA